MQSLGELNKRTHRKGLPAVPLNISSPFARHTLGGSRLAGPSKTVVSSGEAGGSHLIVSRAHPLCASFPRALW